jgi:RNA polymerase sigma-70 factor, ECF subfamily
MDPELRRQIAERHTAARAAVPDVDVSEDAYRDELVRRLGGEATADGLARCHADDVYLAIAACRGDPVAIARVEHQLARELAAAAPRTHATPEQLADARGAVRELLFTDTPERIAALRSFAGRGDLSGYLRVIVTRELVKVVQRGRREAPHEDAELLGLLSTGGDPELSLLREHYREGVTACVRDALGKLDARSRGLLRYQLVDGLTVDRVGELHGVHRATAARWIVDAREKLGELIRAEVMAQLKVSRDEVDSIVRLVQSRVDLSLARLV